MSETKKQHYVPRLYLKRFTNKNNRVKVFDKFKLEVREQKIMDIAMENCFYDIDIEYLLTKIPEDKADEIKKTLIKDLEVKNWDEAKLIVSDKKYIERDFYGKIESEYGSLLQRIIDKNYNGNQWVIDNCFAMSEDDKRQFSFYMAIQFIRTKDFRENFSDIVEEFYKCVAATQLDDMENDIIIEANKDFVKLQHNSMVMSKEMIINFADIFNNLRWVVYVNKTDNSFYTSDNPLFAVSHDDNSSFSNGGLASENVEVIFPLSPSLMISMYGKAVHNKIKMDRKYVALEDENLINYFNTLQVAHSYRCLYSNQDNFDLAKQKCIDNPWLQKKIKKVSSNYKYIRGAKK